MPASQHLNPKSDIEIAQAAKKRPIMEIAREKLGIAPENLEPYGHYKAKVSMDYIKSLKDKPNGKLILVSAITPTPAGEGKTTTTVGLTDALNHIGKKAMLCLRDSLQVIAVKHVEGDAGAARAGEKTHRHGDQTKGKIARRGFSPSIPLTSRERARSSSSRASSRCPSRIATWPST